MKALKECQCADCQDACVRKPGWFMPDQIEPLAKALGLTVKELFDKHLQVDWWEANGDEDAIFVLSPRAVGRAGATMFDATARGVCHWFIDEKCAIHKLGKPFECAELMHNDATSHHRAVAEAWRAPEHQQMIRTLLGREPKAKPFVGGGMSRFGLGGLF